MTFPAHRKTEAVLSDRYIRMNNDVITDRRAGDDRTGADRARPADDNAGADDNIGPDITEFADSGVWSDQGAGINGDAVAERRRVVDRGAFRNAVDSKNGSWTGCIGIEQRQHLRINPI